MLGARNGNGCSQCLWTKMAVLGAGSCTRRKSECMAAMCSQNEGRSDTQKTEKSVQLMQTQEKARSRAAVVTTWRGPGVCLGASVVQEAGNDVVRV